MSSVIEKLAETLTVEEVKEKIESFISPLFDGVSAGDFEDVAKASENLGEIVKYIDGYEKGVKLAEISQVRLVAIIDAMQKSDNKYNRHVVESMFKGTILPRESES